MNQRIQELKAQCYIPIVDRVGDTEYDMEKFAELLIRECAKFLDENSGYDDSNNAWHPEPEDMLKHFGLENTEEFEYDGQPDEAQEWHDFDPDC
jgi:hypothetical protein